MGTISRAGRAPGTPASPLTHRAPLSDPAQGGWKAGHRAENLGARAVKAVASVLIVWQKRLRDRDALRTMSAAQLMDLGIRREDALREAEKPFWRR